MTHKAHYHQYHVEKWKDFPSAQDAYNFLYDEWRKDALLPVGIVNPDGTESPFEHPHFVRILSVTVTSSDGTTTVESYD